MALTRSFKETIRARAQRDPAFRRALLKEALEQLIAVEPMIGNLASRERSRGNLAW